MINFHNVRWKNFLSTGNVWTDIQLDRSPNTLVIGENGAGKSTMLDALCYALFAKPFRKINKPQLRNSVNLKDTLVEVTFTIGNSSYKIVRGMTPNIFEIYKDDSLLNQTASARDYQTYLEQNILKLNYNSFTQIVILGSSSFIPFMQLPTGARREIIEDLLDIKIFTAMNFLLKEKIQTNKDELKEVKLQTGLEQEKLEVHQKFIDDIRSKNKERIDSLKNEVLVSEGAIDVLDADIEEYNNEVTGLQGSITDEQDVNNKLNEIRKIESKLEDRKKKFKKDIKF